MAFVARQKHVQQKVGFGLVLRHDILELVRWKM